MGESISETAAGDLLAAALAYAAAGYRVLPLHTAAGGACSCGRADCSSPGKHPRNSNGLTGASSDVAAVAAWWQRWPDANVGLRTGRESGLVVLDVDPRHGGLASLEALKRERGALPKGPKVLTGSGGQHVYFRYLAGVRNSAGALGEGLDVRGDGGFVVAPPSLHASGDRYRWLHGLELELPDATTLLAGAIKRRNGPVPASEDAIPEGLRDSTLASLAGTMRRRGMSAAAILAALIVENERCRPPLPPADLERIAASVARYAPENVPKAEHLEPFVLEVLTAKAVCELPGPSAADELLGPLVIRGQRIVLGGHTGEGKTSAALHVIRGVVTGAGFLEWTGAGGRALFVDAEQGLRTIQRRLREVELDRSESVDYIRVPEGLSLDSDPRHIAEVERVLADGQYALVAIDPLYKLHTGDSNAEREAVDLMKRLDAWREALGFALFLPVHCRKPLPGTKFSIHDLFGSSAYVRGAEIVLGIQRVSDGYSRLHFLKDRDGDLPIGTSWGLFFSREEGFRRDPNDGKRETTMDKLRPLLAADRTWTNEELAEELGVTERTVRRARKELDFVTHENLFEEEP